MILFKLCFNTIFYLFLLLVVLCKRVPISTLVFSIQYTLVQLYSFLFLNYPLTLEFKYRFKYTIHFFFHYNSPVSGGVRVEQFRFSFIGPQYNSNILIWVGCRYLLTLYPKYNAPACVLFSNITMLLHIWDSIINTMVPPCTLLQYERYIYMKFGCCLRKYR